MEPVAFTFRNNRLTAELITPCGVGAAQLASEPFSQCKTVFSFQIPSTHENDFVKQIEQGIGQKKSKKKR